MISSKLRNRMLKYLAKIVKAAKINILSSANNYKGNSNFPQTCLLQCQTSPIINNLFKKNNKRYNTNLHFLRTLKWKNLKLFQG